MHIGLVIWALCKSKGGIERIGVHIAHEMKSKGHDVTILCHSYNKKNYTPVYSVSEEIKIEYIDNINDKSFFSEKKELLLKLNLDVLCALFSWETLLIFPKLLLGTGIPFIISEHNNPDIIINERWNHYERLGCLASADKIHLLVDEYKQSLPQYLQVKSIVIPNPSPENKIIETGHREKHRLLAVGRFKDSHKKFSVLITAFSRLARSFPDWELVILGDGEDRKFYTSLINKHKLSDRIKLPGIADDVDSFYASSDIFCIPSRYEGFPMVAVEAQAFGLPIIGFSSCSGVNEIVKHGDNGFLAESETAECLGAWLSLLMQDSILREEMKKKSLLLNKRYNKEKVFEQWEALFVEASKLKGNTTIDNVLSMQQEEAFCKMALTEILNRKNPFNRQYTHQMKTITAKISVIERNFDSQLKAFRQPLDKNEFSTLQKFLLNLYSPFVYIFSDDKKYYFDYRNNTRAYLGYTKHPANLVLKRILNLLGPRI